MWTPFVLTADAWTQYLIPGLIDTLKAAAISIVLAVHLRPACSAWAGSRTLAPVRWVCGVVVEFFRAVPVLLMMFFAFGVYAVNNVFGSDVNPLCGRGHRPDALQRRRSSPSWCAPASTACRAGQSRGGPVDRPQPRARRCARSSCRRRSPRCCRPWSASSSSSSRTPRSGTAITYPELLRQGRDARHRPTRHVIPAYIVVALIFIVINYGLTVLAGRVERRLNRRGRAAGGTITNADAGRPGRLGRDGEHRAGRRQRAEPRPAGLTAARTRRARTVWSGPFLVGCSPGWTRTNIHTCWLKWTR